MTNLDIRLEVLAFLFNEANVYHTWYIRREKKMRLLVIEQPAIDANLQ